MRLSPNVKYLRPSPTLAVGTRAKELRAEGKEILDLSLGEPDFPTPEAIRTAAKKAIDDGQTRYTPEAGTLALRAAISRHWKERKGFDYKPEQIVVTTGAKQALYNAIMALIGPGDEVLIPSPYWVSYPAQVALAGGSSSFVPCRLEDHYQIDPDAVAKAITPYTRMLLLNSPNNPTGAVYTPDRMNAVAQLLRENPHIWLLCDDIYDRLVYGEHTASNPLEYAPDLIDRTVLVNGFSKAYAMTGWRIGYLAAPLPVAKAAIAVQGACTSGTNAPTQYAAITALSPALEPTIEQMRQTFAQRLHIMLEEFSTIPDTQCAHPQGAFYLMVNFSFWLGSQTPQGNILHDSLDLATYLLEQGYVAGVPGDAFGAPGTIRFAYATDTQTIRRAAVRIKESLQQLTPVHAHD